MEHCGVTAWNGIVELYAGTVWNSMVELCGTV